MSGTQLFTIERANKMLPLLRNIVNDIVITWEQIVQLRTETEPTLNFKKVETSPSSKEELNHFVDKINAYIKEVEDLGCLVEEFRGIINIPSLFHGRKVFLCWTLKEERVSYWHEIDETFDSRVDITNDIYSDKVGYKLDLRA